MKCKWELATCGILSLDATLERMLSNFFIGELDEGTECILSTFADDTELMGAVDTREVRETIEGILNSLGKWADM